MGDHTDPQTFTHTHDKSQLQTSLAKFKLLENFCDVWKRKNISEREGERARERPVTVVWFVASPFLSTHLFLSLSVFCTWLWTMLAFMRELLVVSIYESVRLSISSRCTQCVLLNSAIIEPKKQRKTAQCKMRTWDIPEGWVGVDNWSPFILLNRNYKMNNSCVWNYLRHFKGYSRTYANELDKVYANTKLSKSS